MSHLTYHERAGYCLSPLSKRLFKLLDDKKTNLCLSADVTHSEQLIALANSLGPEICVLKTHIDIIEDFTPELTHTLQQLAIKHQFLLFEDRKFADIGHTVKLQYGQGLYRIAEWADLINAHTLPGPGIIKGLAEVGRKKNHGLLMLAEMSSQGHLFNQDYINKTLLLAEQFQDFAIGFITQRALSTDPHWIYFSPGIQLAEGGDILGQMYHTPEKAILENGSDIIIVGRGIIHDQNPLEAARQYRELGWQAYQRRCEDRV